MEKLLNLIFIPECIFCHETGSFFCAKCLSSCKRLGPVRFYTSKSTQAKFLFVYEYERFIRECIRNAKYRNRQFAALKVLAGNVADELVQMLNKHTGDKNCFIVPVPVSKAKLRKRGFNQAELIAQTFSKKLNVPLKTDLLIRGKETAAQFTQNRKQRFENMRGAFEITNTKVLVGAKVLLVDDVCTTGATFLNASKTLFRAGAAEVVCVSLARKSLNPNPV